ncbi:MAG TPA: multiheme c-type cytochrome, partial [Terriglobales bacterium]|nr:multiheme c-type cytochrome [Terriglobales bacterium]
MVYNLAYMAFRFISGSLWLALLFTSASFAQSSPDVSCANCHKKIYDSYQQTNMAKASGKASDGLVTGEFFHELSHVRYRVFEKDGRTWMSYERDTDPKLKGQRELLYYIGSGRKGRSYLFSVQGFLFETPINWYSQEERWNMAPAYTEAQQIPMNLPSLADCLNCHTSGLQAPIAGTENRFAS